MTALDRSVPVSLLLVGLGLLLLPAHSPAGRRLAWLAGQRWPNGSPAGERAVLGTAARRWAAQRHPVVLAAVLALGAGLLAGPVPGLLAGLAGLVLGHCWRRVSAERAQAGETAALAEAVAAIMAEHAAGTTLAVALSRAAESAGAHRVALLQAGRLASLGQQPSAALAGEPALAGIAVAAELVGRSGVSIEDVLRGVRSDLRAEQQVRTSVAEVVAGPRSSALLLTVLPVAGVGMGLALGAHPQRVLLHTGAGQLVLSTGVLLDLIGIWWVLRLTSVRRPARRPTPPRIGPPERKPRSAPPERKPRPGRARASPLGRP